MRTLIDWMRATSAAKWVASVIITWAGLAYMILPPLSTVGLYQVSWPARVWGGMMLIGGVVTLYGMVTRVIDWEKFGLTIVLVGLASLSVNQTMLMVDFPPTWTRMGGTLVYWAGSAWVLDRIIRLSADKQMSSEAEARYEGR